MPDPQPVLHTPNLNLPYPELATGPADVPFFVGGLAQRLDALGPGLVTSLPANPIDGQEVVYVADAAAGVLWRLRYRAAAPAPYRWEFLGGSGLQAVDAPTLAAPTAWGWQAPSLTVPLAGLYEIQQTCSMRDSATAGTLGLRPFVDDTPLGNVRYAWFGVAGTAPVAAAYTGTAWNPTRATAPSAGAAINFGLYCPRFAVNTDVRQLWVRPIRVS